MCPQYVQEVLRSRQPLVLFLEEPSAALWLSEPARRWLLRVLRALRDGAVPDALIVPVGIAYDVPPGGMGQDGTVRAEPGLLPQSSGMGPGEWCFPQIPGTIPGDQRSPKPPGSAVPLNLWEHPWGVAFPQVCH